MNNIIQLLPDAVANQIAAGEVVQRPASAVKELLENAIDAGADRIELVIKDAGKALIQVIDNGCGMSPTDARLCFERHATSKVRKAEDLFAIRTMGFRGEAMASIAAIAQVELKTRRFEDELGSAVQIEGSEVLNQEPVAVQAGTQIAIKNLFYNTPARRNFLKSNAVEMRHIIDEFTRVALAHPQIFLSLHHDQVEVFNLPKGNLKQRIVHLFGNNYNERLVPVEEETTIINLKGFIGKPQYAKKTRGEQFFFVNQRFVKDPYLHHAVASAYEDLLPDDSHPFYTLFIEIDPAQIDVNVHPTKTEIKYVDEKSIYAILKSAIKRSIGRYNIAPSLDFNQETGFSHMISTLAPEDITPPSIKFNPDFNPFASEQKSFRNPGQNGSGLGASTKNWASLYEVFEHNKEEQLQMLPQESESPELPNKQYIQLNGRYIASSIKSGLMLIDQQAAHERILFEKFMQNIEVHKGASQQCLFPQTVDLNAGDFAIALSLLDDLKSLGFDIRPFGKQTLVIEGIPVELGSAKVQETQLIEQLIEHYKNASQNIELDHRTQLARSLAKNSALKAGTILSTEEMNNLIDELFACESPNFSLQGKPIIQTITLEELDKKFEK